MRTLYTAILSLVPFSCDKGKDNTTLLPSYKTHSQESISALKHTIHISLKNDISKEQLTSLAKKL